MKSVMFTAAAAAAAMMAAPAFAQDLGSTSLYGDLGYSHLDGRGTDNGAVTGRLGAQFGPYLGAEGELSGGVDANHGQRINDQYAGYAVGHLPVAPKLELLARIGYGATDFRSPSPAGSGHATVDSVNYGVGGQYMMDPHNGLRVDYTRYDYQHVGGDANTWSLAYVRKF
jgi:hypothetical protein